MDERDVKIVRKIVSKINFFYIVSDDLVEHKTIYVYVSQKFYDILLEYSFASYNYINYVIDENRHYLSDYGYEKKNEKYYENINELFEK